MQILGKHEVPITSVESWFASAPPKGKERHWRDYRSAKEIARAWFPASGPAVVPAEMASLLESHPLTRCADFSAARGWPELRVTIDDLVGEPRNTDLAFVYEAPAAAGTPRRVAVSVEAKADESLGPRVEAAIRAAEARRRAKLESHGDERARALLAAVLGDDAVAEPAAHRLRYQLLTAVAGALAFAREQGATVAVLAVHEFEHALGIHTRSSKLQANSRDIDAFVTRLSRGEHPRLVDGTLVGPFQVPGTTHVPREVALLVGKARRVLP